MAMRVKPVKATWSFSVDLGNTHTNEVLARVAMLESGLSEAENVKGDECWDGAQRWIWQCKKKTAEDIIDSKIASPELRRVGVLYRRGLGKWRDYRLYLQVLRLRKQKRMVKKASFANVVTK